MLITQGTVDTLFTLREAISNYEAMRVHNIPTKMMWFCGGHGGCITGSGEAGHIERAVLAWFARYLDGDTSVQTGPRFEWLADDAQWRSASEYPLPAAAPLTAIGSGTLPIAPTPSGALVAATVAANAVNVALPAPGAPAHVVGEPTLKLNYNGIAHPAKTHVYAQLLDSTGRVVGNIATPIPVTLDGVPRSIIRRLEAIASEAAPGQELHAPGDPGEHALHHAALGRPGQPHADRDLAAADRLIDGRRSARARPHPPGRARDRPPASVGDRFRSRLGARDCERERRDSNPRPPA